MRRSGARRLLVQNTKFSSTKKLRSPADCMDLFSSKQNAIEIVTKTAAGKISNGAAVVVNDLTREPAKGLLHVVSHVQKSVPGLVEPRRGLEAATSQLQSVLAELQDAQESIGSIVSPATQQDLSSMAASYKQLQQLSEQSQQQQQTAVEMAQTNSSSVGVASGVPSAGSSFVKSLTNPVAIWRTN